MNDVIFNNEISAFNDWNIVLTNSEIPFPEPKTSIVNIKGADGVLDLSEVLSGEVKYSTRTLKLTFELLDDTDYTELINRIGSYIHGKKITLQFTNDDLYYYVGRATINNWECIKRKGKIVISVDCEPYKYRVNETVINVEVLGHTRLVLTNERLRVYPTLSVQGNVFITCNGNGITKLEEGVYRSPNVCLVEGDNLIKMRGAGSIKFTYRMGAL